MTLLHLVLAAAIQIAPLPPTAPPTPLYSIEPVTYEIDEGCLRDQYGWWAVATDDTMAFSSKSCTEAISRTYPMKAVVHTYWSEAPVKRFIL